MPMRPPLARVLLSAGIALALASCQSPPEITGRVTPRAHVELPDNAVLEVQVADVSRTDAAPVVLAKRDYARLGTAPWTFTLRGDAVRGLDPTHVYAVQARVLVDGRPRLVNKRRTLVDPARLADTLQVVVEPVARTVGLRPEGTGTGGPEVWNPPGAPVTLPAPIPHAIARSAAGPVPAPADAPSFPTTRAE